MRRALALVAAVAALAFVAACGDGGNADPSAGSTAADAATTPGTVAADTVAASDVAAGLPSQCAPAPYTVVAQRDGEQPAGSEAFGVVGSAALPIPLVPNKAGALTTEQVAEQGTSTDLLGYVLFFGDEPFGPSDVSMFGGYAPTAQGMGRGAISVFPNSTTPITVGDVLTPGALDALDMVTYLNRINLDFKAGPDELTSYLNSVEGSVTVLGLTDAALCLDVDLSWQYSRGSEPLGTLTVKGIFTAPLAPRTQPFT